MMGLVFWVGILFLRRRVLRVGNTWCRGYRSEPDEKLTGNGKLVGRGGGWEILVGHPVAFRDGADEQVGDETDG